MLSDEEKRRIEEEEAYRAQVRDSHKKKEQAAQKKGSGCGCGSIVGIGAIVLVVIWAVGSGLDSGSSKSSTTVDSSSFDVLLSSSPTNVASVDFTSDPSGAELFIGGKARGTTPITISVPVGREWSYSLRVPDSVPNHELYHSYTGKLNVDEDTAISVWIERLSSDEVAALTARREEAAARARAAEEERERQLEAQKVYYRVESNCRQGVDITMSNANGDTAQYSNQSNSFSYWMVPRTGTFLYLSAQNQCDSGYVTVRFVQDGEVIRENTSRGAYVIATISGRW